MSKLGDMAGGALKTTGKGAGTIAGGGLVIGGTVMAFDAVNKTYGGIPAEWLQDLVTSVATPVAEAGAQVQANATAQGVYANLNELGQFLSGFSAAMGLNQDLGIGLQNFTLAMRGETQLTNDVFGRETPGMSFANNNNDILNPRDNASAPVADNDETLAPDAQTAGTTTPPTETPETEGTEETAEVSSPEETITNQVADVADDVNSILSESNGDRQLIGSSNNPASPCGSLSELYQAAANYNGANSNGLQAEIAKIGTVKLALQECGI